MRVPGFVLMALCVASGMASAQSLGELAAREQEKRQREGKKPAKVYTENDLRSAGAGTLSQPGATNVMAVATKPEAAAPSEGAAAEKKEKTEDELFAERQDEWRDRLTQARAEVERLQNRVNELQTALNDLTQNIYGGTRTVQLNQMEQAKKDLAAAQQKIADLEEEGRRNRYR